MRQGPRAASLRGLSRRHPAMSPGTAHRCDRDAPYRPLPGGLDVPHPVPASRVRGFRRDGGLVPLAGRRRTTGSPSRLLPLPHRRLPESRQGPGHPRGDDGHLPAHLHGLVRPAHPHQTHATALRDAACLPAAPDDRQYARGLHGRPRTRLRDQWRRLRSRPPRDDPDPLPQPGFPTFVSTKGGTWDGWGSEVHCDGQREDAMQDKVLDAIMKSDPVGSTWGPVDEGLNRIRNFVRWGWNKTTAAQGGVLGGSVPVLIAYGEYDRQVNTSSEDPDFNFSVPALYKAIAGDHKLMVKLDCAGHSVVWEMQHEHVHDLSKHWLKHLKVDGKTQGIFNMNTNRDISPAP
ncbi:conserved hypothetical protein [Streptomyces sviceus ATCC 29083]|uniref:Alpha/beta hydrolase n=1 Tax=Streptomyces sviceus (strain ATCC 29083 / DSM 924 / JCM 4929 / NBRC 13980 / NCIMB 11184 / NRRL 5439 / UC 5370) TaxID=463191 RepID=B5HS10_STRX2|nr:conserved hypothetical protein [Streptomyces sviceus ATCC 29083]